MYTVRALAAPYRNVTAVAAVAVTLSFSVLTRCWRTRFRRAFESIGRRLHDLVVDATERLGHP
jgi:hypothetical protein